jgi:hypothetical protein
MSAGDAMNAPTPFEKLHHRVDETVLYLSNHAYVLSSQILLCKVMHE